MPLHGEIVVIKRNGTDGTHFPLTATSCLFGRKTECDIRIQLPHVSKEHCKVEVKGNGEVFLTNLSSVNPTQVNGATFKQPVRLKHGDVITIIDRSFRFEKSPAQQGKRRSTGLDSETFKVFASNQSSDTNETVRIETLTNKTQRKSEGNITKTTHSRRSLQISSEPGNDRSPFGELYEMLKSEVGSKKQNGKTPGKDEGSTPKNAAVKRSLQNHDRSQFSKRTSRRSQSSESPITRPRELVEPRSASAGRVREASKSPSRSPKTSTKALNESIQGKSAQEPEQTTRRSSSKRISQSVPQEQVTPSVNGNTESPRSASAEQSQVIAQVHSTLNNAKSPGSKTPQRRSNQSVPEQPVLKNQDSSPRQKSPTQGRRSASLDKSPKRTPNKPVTEGKTSAAGPRRSPRKRRSDELSLPDPPPKRKRVSFGGHLSPELFDKRLPPNSPLKKGATPARRSLSLHSSRTVTRKSFGLKQSVIREVFEKSKSSATTPTRVSQSSPARSSPAVSEKSQASKSPTKTFASVKSPRSSLPANRSVSETSPVKMPSSTSVKTTPVKKSPSAKSPVKSPSRSPKKSQTKRSPVAKTPSPAKRSPVAKTPSPAKRSPVAKTPSPAKRSPVAKTPSPAKRSPVAKTPSPAKRSPVAKTPSPAKRSPVAKTPSPAKRSPVAKTPSPAKRSPVAKTPSSAKRSPVAKTPSSAKRSPVAKTPSSAKRSPVAKTPSSAKRSPVAKTPSSAKRSPVAKTPSSAKRSPVAKTPSSAKRSPVAKTPSSAKRSPVAKTPSPAKRSPVAKTPTPAKRSPVAKTPTPAKRSPVAKMPTPAKRSPVAKMPTPAKRSPVAKTPTPATPATPYVKGRFSISRINTPPRELPASKTPNKSRKSLSMKKTPRRSRKLEAFELIRSRRRSGATEANLLVSRTWADIVKIGVAKTQKKIDKPVQKVVATKKKLKHKTPMKKIQHLTSTGHADSPATILVGRAHTRVVNLTGCVPKIVRNQAVKLDSALNESFTGVAELFSTPTNKQRKSNRLGSSKTDSPNSVVVEMSVMQTPEESGEMVVSPLDSPNTTRRKQYNRDAVSRLLHSPASPELQKDGNAKLELEEETLKSQKDERKSLGLSGIKRVMRTPKQKGGPVTDPHALRKLLRTPKETKSTQSYSRRSTNLEVLGIDGLVKTPKQKGVLVEDLVGVKRIMKTPKQKGEPVEDFVGVKRIMRTPKEKVQPVEDMIGIKRLMRTPKERAQPVDIALNRLMGTPIENVQSTESTLPIEEIFGMRNLIKTPPKSFVGKEVTATDPSGRSAKSLGNTSVHRGKSAKRLSLLVDATSGNNADETAQSQILQESVTESNQEVVKSTQKRGRPSKSQSISSELPKQHVVSGEVTSPRRRGRPSSAAKDSKETLSDAEVTSPTKTVAEIPIESLIADGKVTSPVHKARPSTPAATLKESVADAGSEVTSPRRRGRPSSAAKEPLPDAEVTSPTRRGRPKTVAEIPNESLIADDKVTSPVHKARPSTPAATPKESVADAGSEVTSPRRRGRPSSAAKEPLPDAEVTSPTRRGRPKTVAEIPIADDKVTSPVHKARPSTPAATPKESVADAGSEVTSPRRRGRPSSAAKEPLPDAEVTSPTRRGRPKTVAEIPIADDKVASPVHKARPSTPAATPKESVADAGSEVTSPRRRGRPSSAAKEPLPDAEVTSPTRRGRPKTVAEIPNESLIADDKVTSPVHKARPSTPAAAPKESVADTGDKVTSPRSRGRPSSAAEAPVELLSASNAEVASPRQKGRPSSTEAPNESPVVSDGEIASPTSHKRFGSKVEVLGGSIPIVESGGEVVSPRRRGRPSSTGKVPKESLTVLNAQVASPSQHGKSKAVAEKPKESIPIGDEKVTSPSKGKLGSTDEAPKESALVGVVTSPSRRGRPSTTAVTTESVPLISTTPKGRHSTTTEILKESLPVSEVTSPARRGRPKKSNLTSPAHNEKPSTLPEVYKEAVPENEVTSPTPVGIAIDPIPVAESKTTSQTRRGRQKTKVNMPKEPSAVSEVQVTRGIRSKGTAEIAELSIVVADKLPTTQTRRGRPKASAQVAKVPISVSEVEVSSPTRGSRSKGIAEVPEDSVPVLNELTISQRRRGGPKVTDVTEAAAPTRSSRSKDTTNAAVASVSNKVTSPTRKGRSRNTGGSKQTASVSDDVTSPKQRREPATAEGELDLSQKPSEDTSEKTAKSTRKTVRQNAKKSSKQNADVQEPEPEQIIASVEEKKTQLPPTRGRRKAAQKEQVASEDSNLEDEQPKGLTAKASPVARRGGRRRNAEELSSIESDVAKPKPPKQETRSRGQSKSKGLTEFVGENADSTSPVEPVKSPEAKSPKRSRPAKDLVTELAVESQPKSLRGRANKRTDHFTEASNLVTPENEESQKAGPVRGKSRTARDIGNVSLSDADEQTKVPSAKQQRSSRRNRSVQDSESPEEQNKSFALEDTESSIRGTQSKNISDSDESMPEGKKGRKNAKGRGLKNVEQTVPKSKTKSVQWHPLLAIDGQSTTDEISQDSNETSLRGSRSKGKIRPDTSELQIPAKRSRRGNNQAEAEETQASTNPESVTVSDVVARKRGRKANVQTIDAKSESSDSTEVHSSPQRGRRGASKVDGENNEVRNAELSTSRRQRGVAAIKTPAENESIQSPVKSKYQKGGSGKAKADENVTKSTRGIKRKLPSAEAKSATLGEPEIPLQAIESVLVETENIPARRGRKNLRHTQLQKGEETLPEKPTVSSVSPAKRRKTEAATTAAQKKSSRQQTSKLENEKPSATTKTRASTRSRK